MQSRKRAGDAKQFRYSDGKSLEAVLREQKQFSIAHQQNFVMADRVAFTNNWLQI